MSEWHEEEAKAECLDLRIKVRELEAQVAELTTKYNCAIVQDKLKAESIADLKEQVAQYRELLECYYHGVATIPCIAETKALLDKGEI